MAVTQAQHAVHTNALRDLVANFFKAKPGKVTFSKSAVRPSLPAPTQAPFRNVMTPNQKVFGMGVGP